MGTSYVYRRYVSHAASIFYVSHNGYCSANRNKNIFNKKVINFEKNMDKDGLNNTRFRIVNRENYKDKHEIIEVVI